MKSTAPRERPPGWSAELAGIGVVVFLSAAIAGVGYLLAVVMRLVTT